MQWFWAWQANVIGRRRDDWRTLAGLVMLAGNQGDEWEHQPPYYAPMTEAEWKTMLEDLHRKKAELEHGDSGEH